jgi:hypothetical protein
MPDAGDEPVSFIGQPTTDIRRSIRDWIRLGQRIESRIEFRMFLSAFTVTPDLPGTGGTGPTGMFQRREVFVDNGLGDFP